MGGLSDKGKAASLKSDNKTAQLQFVMDNAIVKLQSLDFTNQVEILDWICSIQDASDHTDVHTDSTFILMLFNMNGYLPDVNTGDEFDGDDPDNFARYIIGQALSGLRTVGVVHHVVTRFAGEWKNKFYPPLF